ncbi:dehydrogenase [Halogeometricum borinquense DSM 11551]|uniref:Dehydrogenase n=1 Tax=Halogeometricum borinquense (strain ATCC 700274 / DSM 11551 / JCM 10706 / KCTC 4070 / PR3) TaxID=469382 RepID=E4NV43_HALBP|nr:Gfo/Idh/MocA family oxidoreductase [Halogeometricum borinquense]ADQ69032.1 predicted dehydrogenase [Halogeometricum borinquense DSM 11551]ELY29466.1 dehydrogenase [Halogeometricum borinquense DSM 11551]
MRFGILSTANIGTKHFLPAIKQTDHEVSAIASRNSSRAQTVADEFGIPEVCDSYEALVAREDIDAIYNPLPNSLHATWTKRAIENDLHVLCEKPSTVDADEARKLRATVEASDSVVMEALMYAYHPRTRRVHEIIRNQFSEIRSVTARFAFLLQDRPDDIRLQDELDGGSMMDVGYYPVDLTRSVLGTPETVYGSLLDPRDSGTDTVMNALFEYPSGATANVSSGFESTLSQFYRVEARNGWLEVHDAFDTPTDAEMEITGEVDGQSFTESFEPTDHYRLEIEHFVDCVAEHKQPKTDLSRAAQNMHLIDCIRESNGRGERITVPEMS